MTNGEATYSELIKELEAEFAGMGELLGEETEAVDEREAATDVIKLLEQARIIVDRVLIASDSGGAGGDETTTQLIERLVSVENTLVAIDAQLVTIRQELTTLRQLLVQL